MNEHKPVLFSEILSESKSLNQTHLKMLDGTFGRGGHSIGLLKSIEGLTIDAFDHDQDAIQYAKENFSDYIDSSKLRIFHTSFHEFEKEIDKSTYDLILLDLGVSSPQLDQAHRGFSFYHDGPLDMRMDQRAPLTAADILNTWDEESLCELFVKYGEVQRPNRVVRAVVSDRGAEPFLTTRSFASLVERIEGWRKKGTHPATKYFMALRIYVNNEIAPLEEVLEKLAQHLNPSGLFMVITFHSMEDRIVKWKFKSMESLGTPKYKKVIVASREEEVSNPRSRSAKLRVFQRSSDVASLQSVN